MNNKYLIYLFLAITLSSYSQNFRSLSYLGNGIPPYYIDKVILDSVHDKLILSARNINYAGDKKVRGIWSWDGNKWDSLRGGINTHDISNNQPNGLAVTGIEYNGKLLVGGIFQSIGGVNATSLATWDGANWDSLPVRAFKFLDGNMSCAVYSFIRFNNTLYIGGVFDTIQGQKANSLATFDGVSFQSVELPLNSEASITDMKVFNGELYICGVFGYTAQPGNFNVLKYNGSNWEAVGNGIKGSLSGASSMEVYNNKLYISGFFEKGAGNAGNLIMKLNGNQWEDAGWGDIVNNGAIRKLVAHHNKLYAFGQYNHASNLPATMAAVFDGNKWCAFADSIDNFIFSSAIYHDTLFIAGAFGSIDGDTTMRCIAKLSNENLYRNCNVIGLSQYTNDSENINLSPNPFSDVITITNRNNDVFCLKIYNTLGEVIYMKENVTNSLAINFSSLQAGLYFAKAEYASYNRMFKIIKQ